MITTIKANIPINIFAIPPVNCPHYLWPQRTGRCRIKASRQTNHHTPVFAHLYFDSSSLIAFAFWSHWLPDTPFIVLSGQIPFEHPDLYPIQIVLSSNLIYPFSTYTRICLQKRHPFYNLFCIGFDLCHSGYFRGDMHRTC